MALLFQEKKDGIQLGVSTDRCLFCEREANAKMEALSDGLLNREEVFVLNINGLRRTICMHHFKELLGDKYCLLSKEEYDSMEELSNMLCEDLSEDEVLELDAKELEKCETAEEAEAYIEKEAEKKEKETKDAKATKAAKSGKGK